MTLKALLLLVLCFLTVDSVHSDSPDKYEVMMKRLRHRGGKYGFNIGKPCPTCPLGAIANRNYKKGDTIAKFSLRPPAAMDLGPYEDFDGAVTSLIQMRYKDPEFDKVFGVYWDTLPTTQEMLCKETFSEEEIDMLQSPELAAVVRRLQKDRRFHFEKVKMDDPSLPITFEDYQRIVAIFSTRTFLSFVDPENTTAIRFWLIPALDMLHYYRPFNCERMIGDAGVMELIATQNIRMGEELSHEYDESFMRLDVSFLLAGSMQEYVEPPLCLVDQDGYDPADPWTDTSTLAAKRYGAPKGKHRELKRLTQRLESFPTTEDEDRALLDIAEADAAEDRDWRKEAILKFRIERKRALAARIRDVRDEIGDGEL